jgi:hypothetical protein
MPNIKFTDTQLVILSATSQREDRGVVLPAKLKGGAAQKLVAKLIDLGLIEEVRARGDLPVWRRDDGFITRFRYSCSGPSSPKSMLTGMAASNESRSQRSGIRRGHENEQTINVGRNGRAHCWWYERSGRAAGAGAQRAR